VVLALVTLASGACASSGAGLRPAAFPTAPFPPQRAPVLGGATAPLLGGDVIRTAIGLRGVPYRLGGETPEAGFDCSGFVRFVYGREHLELPRTVAEQFSAGAAVRLSDVREGDLVFFSTIAPGPSHVGLAIGNGEFIHAPGSTGAVRIERLDAPYWRDRVVGVRRVE
jgi:cell wall-associated NlpC family hydrolase